MTANKLFSVHFGKVWLPPPFVVLTSNPRFVCRGTGVLCTRHHCQQSLQVAWAGCGRVGEECSDQPGLHLERNDNNDKISCIVSRTKGTLPTLYGDGGAGNIVVFLKEFLHSLNQQEQVGHFLVI